MKPLPSYHEFTNCYIAGGAVLSHITKTAVNDIDIYPKNEDGLIECIETLSGHGELVNFTDRALTFRGFDINEYTKQRQLYQIVTFDLFPTAADIFKTFDFTVCSAAFDCDNNSFSFHEQFYEDVASKTIRFNTETIHPIASLIRAQKYAKKGYHISTAEMIKIALTACVKNEIRDWKSLKKALGTYYGKSIDFEERGEFSFNSAVELLSSLADLDLPSEQKDYKVLQDALPVVMANRKKVFEINNTQYGKWLTFGTNVPEYRSSNEDFWDIIKSNFTTIEYDNTIVTDQNDIEMTQNYYYSKLENARIHLTRETVKQKEVA